MQQYVAQVKKYSPSPLHTCNMCVVFLVIFLQTSMNVMKEMTTVLITVPTLLVATSATVKLDTYWTLMNTLAMVSLVFYSYACCNFMEVNL